MAWHGSEPKSGAFLGDELMWMAASMGKVSTYSPFRRSPEPNSHEEVMQS